jgi:hypothetical protein
MRRAGLSSMILVSLLLVSAGCDWRPAAELSTSVIVQLPPARPYKPVVAKPAFSEPLIGSAKN